MSSESGEVHSIDLEEWRIYVDWLTLALGTNGIKRYGELKGCTASIHEQFDNSNP